MIRDSRRPSEDEVRTVLVVEHEILVRLMVADELREAGMRVIEASHADEAMEHVRAGSSIDFVFAEIELPGSMNGLEFIRRLRADVPDLKFLMTSSRMPARERAPIRPFIAKPYDIADVVARIRAALAESSPE